MTFSKTPLHLYSTADMITAITKVLKKAQCSSHKVQSKGELTPTPTD